MYQGIAQRSGPSHHALGATIMAAPLAVCVAMSVAPSPGLIASRWPCTASTRDSIPRKNAASMSGGKSLARVPVGGPVCVFGWPQIRRVVSVCRPAGRVLAYASPSVVDQKGSSGDTLPWALVSLWNDPEGSSSRPEVVRKVWRDERHTVCRSRR